MSKGISTHRGPARGREQKEHAVAEGKRRREIIILVVAILAGIPFVLGRYFEFNFPDPFDSAANVYSAQRVLDGARIGIDERPSAALATLLVNMLGVRLFGFGEFGPKMIQTIVQAIAFVLMFIAMRKAFGTLPAAVGVIAANIYLSSPLIAKYGNVKEQYMIACMITAASLVILRYLNGPWWYSLLAGAAAARAPLFKETRTSAVGAIGLFVLAQAVFRRRTIKQTAVEIGLLLAGAVLAMAPLYIWIIGWDVKAGLPYFFLWSPAVWKSLLAIFVKMKSAPGEGLGYVGQIRDVTPFSQQWPRVLRFYLVLILPVSLAIGSIVVRLWRMGRRIAKKEAGTEPRVYERFVLLLGVWWILDMAFVWISPASYEQYYLPLTASGAMAGGYLIAVYRDKWAATAFKEKWVVIGLVGLIVMVVMSWQIFFGLSKSAYSGMAYGEKRHGYVQRWREISMHKQMGSVWPWEAAGDYIRLNSKSGDKIYVWGWYPGIYVRAQRFSNAPEACESEMHTQPPAQFAAKIQVLLDSFKKDMPKFIVDSRKQHLPLDRPKHELWQTVPPGVMGNKEWAFLPADEKVVAEYERQWSEMLRKRFGDDEAGRYEAVGALRKFVRHNYERVQMFGEHVLFKLKAGAGGN